MYVMIYDIFGLIRENTSLYRKMGGQTFIGNQ
jgi:hypothetical protein